MIIDIVIALIVLGAAWFGYQRGLLQPLLTELFALLTLLLIVGNRDAFAAIAEQLFHANALVAGLMAVVIVALVGYLGYRVGGAIHRMPAVRGVDGFFGVWFQALAAILFCYLLVSGIIVLGRALGPVVSSPTLNRSQLELVQQSLETNPFTGTLIDSRSMDRLDAQARGGGVRSSEIPVLGGMQGMYLDFLRPQLAGSRLAPLVLGLGQHFPGVGRYGPADIPRSVSANHR